MNNLMCVLKIWSAVDGTMWGLLDSIIYSLATSNLDLNNDLNQRFHVPMSSQRQRLVAKRLVEVTYSTYDKRLQTVELF